MKTFFILNSAEHEIYPAHKCLNANNCWHFNIYEHDKLTFISMINTTSERISLFVSILVFRSSCLCSVELSMKKVA